MDNEDFVELEQEETESDDPTPEKPKVDQSAFLAASNTVKIRNKPKGRRFDYAFPRAIIKDVKRSEFLVLGFDTEYQSPKDAFEIEEIKEGKAKYEVVSYQFHAINSNGVEWSGIAIPDDDQRLSFTDFIVYALSLGARKKQQIPKTIILVAHYNRADLPAFEDRKQIFWRLQNVRSSLISASAPISLKVSFDDGDEKTVDISVYVRDTILLAPAGRKSLAEIGKLIEREKIRLSEDDEEELHLKKNMKVFRNTDWEAFREYALIDAEISAKYFLRLTQIYQDVTGEDFVPSALSSIGMKLLVKGWQEEEPQRDPTGLVGKEPVTEVIWNEKTQGFRKWNHKPYLEELSWFVDFVTECYHGGRNEQLWFGPSFEDDWYDYDLTGAYPTAMATIGRLDWRSIRPLFSLNELGSDDAAFVCVDFKFPDGTRYPTLPVRSQNGIIFPLTGRSYCARPEIELAQQLGCELTLKHGVAVPQDTNDKVFFNFIKETIQKRDESPTKMENAFWKELTNSCYGKTAQGLREKRVFSLRKRRGERIGESSISNPFYASYITSFVRAVVGEIMNRIPADKMVFSVTTDGFLTNATEQEMELAKGGPISKRFSDARDALKGDPEVLSEKHRVRQVLGWRTRGQATIKPGGETVDADKRYVLAKAGIKAPVECTETHEQNDYITELFFRRDAVHKIELDYFTSVREMLLWNADLVGKKSKKHISMEYDFKRKPYSAGMTEVEDIRPLSDGPKPHLVFSTEPWNSISEFKQVRSVWNDFYGKTKICLKTTNDFAEFADFFDTASSLSPGMERYMRSKNGDIRRLKRDVCRAFKRGQAGFSAHQNMTAKEFAAALDETGFLAAGEPIKVSDVTNAAKANAPFIRNSTPPTKPVRKIVQKIRERFPEFDELAILAAPRHDAIRLSEALRRSCPFVDRTQASSERGRE
ncbi:DNA polymerase [Afipia sp. GAS231]|uniref:DNA polymerase n=1 Tax=Afipia sp. GAS231 TaxID=1882747 RepID=UPI00087BDF53|nr:DNA polymerase [Afipia sp. GAS231]SDO19925.1 DNA polymerase type B [Afipia sp. GAS231]